MAVWGGIVLYKEQSASHKKQNFQQNQNLEQILAF